MTKKLFNYIRIKKLIVRSTNLFAILANYTASGLGRWAVLKEFFMRLRLQSFTYRGYILTVCGGPRVVQQDRVGSVSAVSMIRVGVFRGLVRGLLRDAVGVWWFSAPTLSAALPRFFFTTAIPEFSPVVGLQHRSVFAGQVWSRQVCAGGGYKQWPPGFKQRWLGLKGHYLEQADEVLFEARRMRLTMALLGGEKKSSESVSELESRILLWSEIVGLDVYYRSKRIYEARVALRNLVVDEAALRTPGLRAADLWWSPPSQAVAAGGSNNSGGFLRMVVEVLLRKGPFLCGTVVLVVGGFTLAYVFSGQLFKVVEQFYRR